MQQVNGVPIYSDDPNLYFEGLNTQPTWFSAQGGVYKCRELSTNREVAIKKYLVEEDSQYENMFVMPKELVENEIYSMTKCVHPNILELLAVYLHQEFVYLIMPLCTGGSLQQYVFEHHLTVGQLVYIIRSIASGLAKLHEYGYIHRDIKCDNIFLNQQDNSIVIGDFGVVSISPAADSSIEEAGVVLFWSPELVQQKIVNYKIDIWALGIVILEVLNGGKAPYEDEGLEEEEIKQRILQVQRPVYPPNLPSQLVDLLDHCLDPDPHTRYSANQILEHPFLSSYEPELLFPATPLQQGKKRKQSPSTPVKCRIPIRAFSVDKTLSASVPVQERILSVHLKRQSLSNANRSQGSRLPMLCVTPILEEKVKKPKEKKPISPASKSNSNSSNTSNTNINTIPSRKSPPSSNRTIPSPSAKSLPSVPRAIPISASTTRHMSSPKLPSVEVKTNIRKPKINVNSTSSIPIKASIYRNKKPGESRTARLMMGISTARRQSYKTRESTTESNLPTLAHKQRVVVDTKDRSSSPSKKQQAITAKTTSNNNNNNSLKGKALRVH
ncbi:Putative STE/STE20/PAKA protein kinase [Rhizopus microsporus]|nr:Putative STE/STE20/PAKA protein kinase [Rhizopus microsporus]